MADTNFTDQVTAIVSAWLQPINNFFYRTAANTLKGNNTAVQGQSIDLTPAQAALVLAPSIVTPIASVQSLRDFLTQANMANGQRASVTSYYGDNNGGGGDFVASTGQAPGTYVDNGGSIIVPTGGDGSAAWLGDISKFNIKSFGAKVDGVTDDATAIQNYINAIPQYGIFDATGCAGTSIIGAQLNAVADNVLYVGNIKLKAQDTATAMTLMFSGSGRTGIVMKDLEFDANKAGRASGQSVTYNGLAFPASTDCTLINVTVRNCLGFGGTSATSISASSAAVRFSAFGSKALTGGTSATILPSDGFFVRGTNCLLEGCTAYQCTDTGFVLEGCNYSSIVGCVAKECTSLAGITNDTATDCVGNTINGLTGSTSYVGSTGGTIGVACFDAGNLRDTKVSDIIVRIEDSAGGSASPIIQVRKTSTGRVIGLTIDNPNVDYGGSTGVIAQAIVVSDSDDVQINNPYLRVERGGGQSGIRFDGTCVNGIVNGGYIDGSDYGVLAKNTSEIKVTGVKFKNPSTTAVYAADTSTVLEKGCTREGSGTDVTRDSGATLVTEFWQSYTPTYSSDIGNAATTFTGPGTVTTTAARYRTIGKKCDISLVYSATLNAVTPSYIGATFPPGVVGQNDQSWGSPGVSNAGTWETGIIRAVGSTAGFRIYRAAVANYGSGAAIEGRFTFGFETA